MKKLMVVMTLVLCSPGICFALEKPDPREVKRVMDYYFYGAGKGAILTETKLCLEIKTEEPDKNECVQVITDNKVARGDDVFIWMNFMVPTNDEASVILGYTRDKITRNTQHVAIPNATRFRTWKKIPTNRTGMWKISIIQELEQDDLSLGTLQYEVLE